MKGLPSRFNIVNGKFELVGGIEKSKDALWFYFIFDLIRVYVSDFGANIGLLLQKPTSQITLSKTLILASLKGGIRKYVPSVELNNIDIGYFQDDRKTLRMQVDFTTVVETEKIEGVIFL